MAKNYYETLGLTKDASQDEIKSAYRKLVKQYHPDLHPGDAQAAEKFKEITGKFVEYWDNVKVLPDLNANGKLSLGENLADHGGVRIALEAWKKFGDGIKSGLREFFLAYSANWAGSIKEEEMRRRVIEDVHSLGRNRVNNCLCHFDEWYEAFDITEEDEMFIPKENRLSIW